MWFGHGDIRSMYKQCKLAAILRHPQIHVSVPTQTEMKSEFFIHICIVFEKHRTERMIAYSNNVACCSMHFWPLSLKWPSESPCRSQKKVHFIVTGPSFKVIITLPSFLLLLPASPSFLGQVLLLKKAHSKKGHCRLQRPYRARGVFLSVHQDVRGTCSQLTPG